MVVADRVVKFQSKKLLKCRISAQMRVLVDSSLSGFCSAPDKTSSSHVLEKLVLRVTLHI